MAFRDSQLGRFGPQAKNLLAEDAPGQFAPSVADNFCASLLGRDSPALGSDFCRAEWLAQRGYLDATDTRCTEWSSSIFPKLIESKDRTIELMQPNRRQGCEAICAHEFIASTLHKPLYGWFDLQLTVATDLDG